MSSPKTYLKVMLTAVILLAASSKLSAGTSDSIIFQNDSTFTIEGVQNELQQDGEWIKVTKAEIDPEGVTDNGGGFDDEINTEYVWRPRNMDPGWTPYTNGYWSYTDCGWMWTSYYSWGWRPYHYGRWWWSDYYGWVWSPGFIWAPAWVVWMFNDGYCGWYPISPRVRWHHDYGYRCHNMRYRVRHWNFCEKKKFHDPLHPPVVIIDPVYNHGNIIASKVDAVISVGGSSVINRGPDVNEIETASGKKIVKEDVKKYNNVDKVTGVDTKEKNTVGTNNEKANNEKKYIERSNEKSVTGNNKDQEKKQDPNTGRENESTKEPEKKYYEKDKEQTREKKKDDTYKDNDGYREEKKSGDSDRKEEQKDSYEKNDDKSNGKNTDDKRSNDNKQESKPQKYDNDNSKKKNNGKE